MESNTDTDSPSHLKQCPFCAETIQAAAIKCRFCGEFITAKRLQAFRAKAETFDYEPETDETDEIDEDDEIIEEQEDDDDEEDEVLFQGRPSMLGMVGEIIKGAVFIALGVFLFVYPVENLLVFEQTETVIPAEHDAISEDFIAEETTIEDFSAEELGDGEYADGELTEAEFVEESPVAASESRWGLSIGEEKAAIFGKYRQIAGFGLCAFVVLVLVWKVFRLKMIYYEVTADRIEWSRGIFDRRVDNIDMFRVVDLQLRRNLLDIIFAIGSVKLVTTDKTDPEFVFEKIRGARKLYDIIKKASLEADKESGVVHLE